MVVSCRERDADDAGGGDEGSAWAVFEWRYRPLGASCADGVYGIACIPANLQTLLRFAINGTFANFKRKTTWLVLDFVASAMLSDRSELTWY